MALHLTRGINLSPAVSYSDGNFFVLHPLVLQNIMYLGKWENKMINKALAIFIFLSISISFQANAATVDLTQSLWIIDGFDTSNWNGSKLRVLKQPLINSKY